MRLHYWCDLVDATRPGDATRQYRPGVPHASLEVVVPVWAATLAHRVGLLRWLRRPGVLAARERMLRGEWS